VIGLALASPPAIVGAQTPTIVGIVRDSAGAPLAAAEIALGARKTNSDSLGRFYLSFPAADSLTISVRRLGYEEVTFTLTAKQAADKSLEVVLHRVAMTLEAVAVTELADRAKTPLRGYDERRARGLGVYVTREQIEKRNTRLITDVLRTMRGVIVRGRQIQFATYQSRNCTPSVWLDGQPAPGLYLDAISAAEVEGIELYQSLSATPPEFHRGNQVVECGTIVIWTRRPVFERQMKAP
jgi:hypothetical protein